MDAALWASVRELLESTAGEGQALGQVGSSVDTGPTGLLDYASYFDIALPSFAETRASAEGIAAATDRLKRRRPAPEALEPRAEPPRITNFSPETYSPLEIEQMSRWWDIEPANRMAMTRARDEEFSRARCQIRVAMEHLRESAPELHGEVETIIRDIVLSRPDGSNLINYGGASSFALWGALTINAETQVEWLQLYRQIVHEAGHNMLFGIARDQPLVANDPGDRSPSPVRADPRPIDGIFHAAFVSAREAFAFEALLRRHEATGCLSEDDAEVLLSLLEFSVLDFWGCVEALRGGTAQLTGLGEAVLADCEAFMTANFAIEPL